MTEATKNNIQVAKYSAIISFSVGTLLFLAFLVFEYFKLKNLVEPLIIIGILYVLLALLFNSIIFLSLLYTIVNDSKYYKTILAYTGLLILNLPISFGYLYLILNIF